MVLQGSSEDQKKCPETQLLSPGDSLYFPQMGDIGVIFRSSIKPVYAQIDPLGLLASNARGLLVLVDLFKTGNGHISAPIWPLMPGRRPVPYTDVRWESRACVRLFWG